MGIKINKTELATNLAVERMKTFIQYQREHAGVVELSDSELDEKLYEENKDGEMVFRKKYQEMFNDFYDMFETEILKCKVND